MAYFSFKNIKIKALACAVPENTVKTESFKSVFGNEEVDKVIDMTGIRQTHRTTEFQTCSDLGFRAANEILKKYNIAPDEIGALLFVSHSPDYRRPATACVLQYRLGIPKDSVCYDISLGCSAFVYGVQTAASIMTASPDIKKALVITGDTGAKSAYPKDRSSMMLYGDAGAVALLEKTDNPDDEIKALMRTDGSGFKYMIIPGGGYRNLKGSDEGVMCKDGNPRTLMNSLLQGTSVFTFTVFDVPKLIKDFFGKTNTSVNDYDVFAMHQANMYILKQIAKKTKIPLEKMPVSIYDYGNTSGASIVLTLCNEYGKSDAEDKLKVFSCGFGVGISLGALSFEIAPKDILPISEDSEIFEEGLFTNPNQLYERK